MLIRVSPYMTLEAQYLTQRGEVYQLYMRVPVDLVDKYGAKFIEPLPHPNTARRINDRESHSLR